MLRNAFFSPASPTAQNWHYCCKRNSDKLKWINESWLRFIFNEYHISYDKLLNNINRPSLHNRRIHDLLTLVYKSFHDLAPSYINELLIEINSSNNLCGKHFLSIPRVQSTKYGSHSFRYSASKYWIMLPEVLRTAESLHVFKSKVKSISFNNKCCSFCN